MNTLVRPQVYEITSTDKPDDLRHYFRTRASHSVFIISMDIGEAFKSFVMESVKSRVHLSYSVLIPFDLEPAHTACIRTRFDEVVTANEFDLMPYAEAVRAIKASDCEDRAIGVSYSDRSGVVTFLTGDIKRVAVPISDIRPHPVVGAPDFSQIRLTDGGHTVTFGGDYEVAFDGLRYSHDAAYRSAVRKRLRHEDRSFGACLRRARFHRELGQGELGVSDRTIRRIESGACPREEITDDTRAAIERKLGMTFDEILTY